RIERFIAMVLLGGLSFVLVVTGIVLVSYYRPTGDYSYHDMKYLQFDVPFGMVMRNLHRHATTYFPWAVILHAVWVVVMWLLRVPPRRTWLGRLTGAALVTALLALPVTGYLMPWDQLSIWSLSIGTEMSRSEPHLGQEGPFADLVGKDARYDAR